MVSRQSRLSRLPANSATITTRRARSCAYLTAPRRPLARGPRCGGPRGRHAIQDAADYPGLVVRNLVVPLAGIGSQLFWLLILAGFLLGMDRLILAGVVLFSSVLIFQLLNVPVELDASRRGRLALMATGMIESSGGTDRR